MRRQTKTHCSNEVTLVPGEKSRCCFARRSAYRAFAPGGVSYDEPSEDDPMGQSEVDPKPARSSVGASAKAHAAKARPPPPESPSSSLYIVHLLHPQASTDASHSSQTPINPSSGDKGMGSKGIIIVSDLY